MAVVWHRLGLHHPLVQELDRISRAENARLIASQCPQGGTCAEPDLPRTDLARQRADIVERARGAISPQAAVAVARRSLCEALTRGPQRASAAANRLLGGGS